MFNLRGVGRYFLLIQLLIGNQIMKKMESNEYLLGGKPFIRVKTGNTVS